MTDYEPGARRRKIAGYLKAANELRQTYAASWQNSGIGLRDGSNDEPVPGAYPSSTTNRTGEEKLVLFPTYARRHVKQKNIQSGYGPAENSTWIQDWDFCEDENAVVDVDVRGWVFTPQSGPLNRKQRLFIAMARQLVGVPAPTSGERTPTSSQQNSRSSSPTRFQERIDARHQRQDEEAAAREADALFNKYDTESRAAQEGAYSERPGVSNDWTDLDSGQSTPDKPHLSDKIASRITSAQQRKSWKTTAQMTPEELSVANDHLLDRLKPFLANPCMNMNISAFFFNDTQSVQKHLETRATGQFALRASLDFVPTHVRIMANERLSDTQIVQITEPSGVSLISDIDDTIKHSAISAGAREIFRNVFIRQLGDLSIDGVKEWYDCLAKEGVMLHYVSNSPWQIYPLLKSYFDMVGLPRGSMHLKQYTGMFQGIFEPVAERKKGSLERILRDFPGRKFILVGDSGEADLEVYTDVVVENPGRILGIYIRDVTMPVNKDGFDPALGPLSGEKKRLHRRAPGSTPSLSSSTVNGDYAYDNDEALQEAIKRSIIDAEDPDHSSNRPALPPRQIPERPKPQKEENLIDLDSSDDDGPPLPSTPPKQGQSTTDQHGSRTVASNKGKGPPPPRPSKPANLSSTNGSTSQMKENRPPNPPLPPRRRTQDDSAQSRPQPSSSDSYRQYPTPRTPSTTTSGTTFFNSSTTAKSNSAEPSSYSPANTIRSLYNEAPFVTADALSSTTYPPEESYRKYYDGDPNPPNKKEELWKRRWARARAVLDDRGVVLRAWREGGDVADESVKLAERALKEFERRGSR